MRRGNTDAETATKALLDFRKLKERMPGLLDSAGLAQADRAVRDIVQKGQYRGILPDTQPVRFENVGCWPRKHSLDGFFVEFRPLAGGDARRLGVEQFLREYKFFIGDYALI